jgi:hypothetical protein
MKKMNEITPRKIATAGGIFITLSGILNFVLGIQIGALHYYPYPGGKMGHVGITAGLAAIGIGLVITFALPRMYLHQNRKLRILGSVLTFILGHIGAVFGALFVGTVGVILCYVGGIWLLIIYLKSSG